MRSQYIPESEKLWIQYFSDQANQSGAGFIGLPYQRGAGIGSIFRSIFRALLPIAKSASKSIGKQALSTGAQIASDLVAGDSIKAATKRHTKAGAAALLNQAAKKLQSGNGIGKRPATKRKSSVKKKTANKRQKVSDQLGLYYK